MPSDCPYCGRPDCTADHDANQPPAPWPGNRAARRAATHGAKHPTGGVIRRRHMGHMTHG